MPFRMSKINVDVTASENMTVHCLNCLFDFGFLRELDEGKLASTPGDLLVDDLALDYCAEGTEGLLKLLLRGFEREVSNEDVSFHTSFEGVSSGIFHSRRWRVRVSK